RARPQPRSCRSAGRRYPSADALLQLLEQLALLLVHALRHLDADTREHVALALSIEPRGAAALDPQQLAVLRARGNLERDRTLRRGNLDLAAERGSGEGNGHLHDQVVTAPLIGRRRRDPRDDDQVAVRATVLTYLALPLEPDLRPVLDARLDLYGERAPPPLAAGAVALLARLLDHGAVASTAPA